MICGIALHTRACPLVWFLYACSSARVGAVGLPPRTTSTLAPISLHYVLQIEACVHACVCMRACVCLSVCFRRHDPAHHCECDAELEPRLCDRCWYWFEYAWLACNVQVVALGNLLQWSSRRHASVGLHEMYACVCSCVCVRVYVCACMLLFVCAGARGCARAAHCVFLKARTLASR